MRLILLAALAAIMAGTVAAYLLNPPAQVPVDVSGAKGVGGARPGMDGLTFSQVKGGVLKWTLTAKGANLDPSGDNAVLTDVKIVFYGREGGWTSIRGNIGDYDQKRKVLRLHGDVLARTHTGRTLRTQELTYSEAGEVIDTDKDVEIRGDNFRVRSKGMKCLVATQFIIFKNRVETMMLPRGSGPPPGATLDAPPTGQGEDN